MKHVADSRKILSFGLNMQFDVFNPVTRTEFLKNHTPLVCCVTTSVEPHIVFNFSQQPTTAKCFGDTVLLISYSCRPIREIPKRAEVSDDDARCKKHNSLIYA